MFDAKLKEFIESDPGLTGKSQWFETHGLSVYLRNTQRRIDTRMLQVIDVANVNAESPGHGSFTRFLIELEDIAPRIYVESVQNKRLEKFLRSVGYVQVNADYDTINLFWERK